ncbi:hypothetical protein C8R43DRAFT_1040135 [Mycena crocata]|nr:hypothetical protein C8R43DRAFT_1040135 [Mycena crocata]
MSSQKRTAPNEFGAPPTSKERKTDSPSLPTDSTSGTALQTRCFFKKAHGSIIVLSASESQFASNLSDTEKTLTLRYILDNLPVHPSSGAITTLASMQIEDLKAHSCTWGCLVRLTDAQLAGQYITPGTSTLPSDRSRFLPPVPAEVRTQPRTRARKRQRTSAADRNVQTLELENQNWADIWPQVESEEFLKEVRNSVLYFSVTTLIQCSDHQGKSLLLGVC